jgi:hypothetical protein
LVIAAGHLVSVFTYDFDLGTWFGALTLRVVTKRIETIETQYFLQKIYKMNLQLLVSHMTFYMAQQLSPLAHEFAFDKELF